MEHQQIDTKPWHQFDKTNHVYPAKKHSKHSNLPLAIFNTRTLEMEDSSKGNSKRKHVKSDCSIKWSRQEFFPVVVPLAVCQMTAVSYHKHTKLPELQQESDSSKYDCERGKNVSWRISPPICKKHIVYSSKQCLYWRLPYELITNNLDTRTVWYSKDGQKRLLHLWIKIDVTFIVLIEKNKKTLSTHRYHRRVLGWWEHTMSKMPRRGHRGRIQQGKMLLQISISVSRMRRLAHVSAAQSTGTLPAKWMSVQWLYTMYRLNDGVYEGKHYK